MQATLWKLDACWQEGGESDSAQGWGKEEIEKALLRSPQQTGRPPDSRVVKGNKTKSWNPIQHTGWPCKQGWFLCTTPAKRHHSIHEDRWRPNSTRHVQGLPIHHPLQTTTHSKTAKYFTLDSDNFLVEAHQSFSVEHFGTTRETLKSNDHQVRKPCV